MSSILTNNSALSALQSLTTTQKSLQTTQNQISSGLKIATAADNAGYWSIATQMRSDDGALGAIADALNVSGSMIDTFTSAVNQTIDVVNKIKNSLIAAQQPGSDAAKIQTDIAAQQNELKSMVAAANFDGDNWLQGDSTAASTTPGSLSNSGVRKLVASYNNATGVSAITVTTSGTTLIDSNTTTASATNKGILSADGAASGKSVLTMDVTSVPTGKTIADFLKDVDAAIKSLTTVSATLGGAKAAVTTQQSFIDKLQDSLTSGVSSLVDADMNEASTRLQALQTQQQLGVQALSIANQNSQMILQLFRS
jgi:flagellin